jgi:hypothetical protein
MNKLKEIIKQIENININFRDILTSKDFDNFFFELTNEEKENLIQVLFVSVTNSKILSNKLIKYDRPK